MTAPPRRKVWLVVLVLVAIASAWWLYTQRYASVDMATYVPGTAIGYLEVNDWTRLVDDFTSSKGWADLAPVYGIWDKWKHVGLVARAIRATGLGTRDQVLLARSQFVVFVTSIQVNGEEVRPRLAIIAETHSSPSRLTAVIDRRLPQLAARILGDTTEEASAFRDLPVRIFRSKLSERRLYSAQIESEWIVANHTEAIEAAINTRQERVASMANDEDLAKARVGKREREGLAGFVSSEGTSRLARFAASISARRVLGETVLLESLESIVSDLTSKASKGVAYQLNFEDGIAIETWGWLCPTEMAAQLRAGIQLRSSEPGILKLVPETASGMTLVNAEDPRRALETVESIVSARMGAAQSFLFHRFLIGAREALLGFREGESAAGILGNEIVIASIGPEPAEQAWLINIADRTRLDPIVERFLSTGGAQVSREMRSGYLVLTSTDERRGAVAFLDDIVAFGSRTGVGRLLDARSGGRSLAESQAFTAASLPNVSGVLLTFSSVREETQRLMESLAGSLPRRGTLGDFATAIDKVPLSASIVRVEEWGILVESHSTFGSLTWPASLFIGAESNQLSDR